MKLPRERRLFQQERKSPLRWVLLTLLIVVWWMIFSSYQNDEIEPLFLPTPTSTRTANSFGQEGEANYISGDLDDAILAYEDALRVDPENTQVLVELARIQTYSSSMLTHSPRQERLAEALENIEFAVEINPMDSNVHAIYALVLDWSAFAVDFSDQRDGLLLRASEAAIRATQLDSQNPLALAYRAEVLSDQGQWIQARQLAEQAVAVDPNIMDTHRVLATVLEASGFYNLAIEEYKLASEIEPNFTYLYIKIGQNYRVLRLYDQALDYFDIAATINERLGIEDPLPYIAIAKTYSRDGEFFIAARNVERAMEFDPTNPDIYGTLGIIRNQARNYEDAILVLRCAVYGCSAEDNIEMSVEIIGLPLRDDSLAYYLTLGSLLAAYGEECDEIVSLMDAIEAEYAEDEITMGVVTENRNIWEIFCSS